MTLVTAQLSVSLDGFYAGTSDVTLENGSRERKPPASSGSPDG